MSKNVWLKRKRKREVAKTVAKAMDEQRKKEAERRLKEAVEELYGK